MHKQLIINFIEMALKRILPIFMLLIFLGVPSEAKKKKDDGGNAIITFKEQTHDFGIIPEKGGAVTTEFEFTNTGNGPLVIYNASADCGCTRPQYPRNPIAPGKSGKIKVTFIPQGYAGGFMKNVKVKSNGSAKTKVLKITGTVNPNSDSKKK